MSPVQKKTYRPPKPSWQGSIVNGIIESAVLGLVGGAGIGKAAGSIGRVGKQSRTIYRLGKQMRPIQKTASGAYNGHKRYYSQ